MGWLWLGNGGKMREEEIQSLEKLFSNFEDGR